MKVLIIKLGATGDVVRTSTLLHVLDGEIDWLTSDMNVAVLKGCDSIKSIVPWSERFRICGQTYDFVINLEDQYEVSEILKEITFKDLFGSYINKSDKLDYTQDSRDWFDLSLISRFGKERADILKLQNRKSYQEILFSCLGFVFDNHTYYIPNPEPSDLKGDIAIAPKSGTVWPMKNWAYYGELKDQLESDGYRVNVLPMRDTLLQHFGDIRNHKLLISGDSLPMHIALAYGIKCVSIFICTSPWEIHDYGIQEKIVSPFLSKFFYQRDFYEEATTSISLHEVYSIAVRVQKSNK